MSDLFEGRTMTEAFKCISAGSAATFTFGHQPDKVLFYNLTDWTATAGTFPTSMWIRTLTTDTDAYQQQVIDSAAGASFNFVFEGTNGFTVADTSGGQTATRSLISAVSQADPCVITTTTVHGLQNDQIVRITDLGSDMPTARGMEQINNLRFRIVVVDTSNFSLKDVITDEAIDSTSYTAWVAGGRVVPETRVISLNNPQVAPYATTPYLPNQFEYDPITYKLTAGSAVMAGDGDIFFIEAIRYGNRVKDLGDLGA